jgi:hypothetical protein
MGRLAYQVSVKASSISSVIFKDEERNRFSSFARGILSLRGRTEYRRCDKGKDLNNYRSGHRACRSGDMVPDGKSLVIDDELDKRRRCTASAPALIVGWPSGSAMTATASRSVDLKMLVNGWGLA